MRRRRLLVLGTALLALAGSALPAQAFPGGWIDQSFAAGGVVEPGGLPLADGMVVDSTGRVLILSNASPGPQLTRYSADGQLDAAFGTGGSVALSAGLQYSDPIVASDSSIYVVSSISSVVVDKYSTAGIRDTSFGTQGRLTLPSAVNAYAAVAGLVEMADGTLVLEVSDSGAEVTQLWAFTPTGTLDTAFNATGTVPGSVTLSPAWAGKQPIAAVGTSVVVMTHEPGVGPGTTIERLRKFGASGQLDATFGAGGVVDLPSWLQSDGALAAAPDASLYLGSWALDTARGGSWVRSAVAHLLGDGSLDASFGTGGVALGPSSAQPRSALRMTLAGGGLYLAGRQYSFPVGAEVVDRFSTAGLPDPTFGSAGELFDPAHALATDGLPVGLGVQPSGAVVLGTSGQGAAGTVVAVTRLAASSSAPAGAFIALPAARVLDTRTGIGAPAVTVPSHGSVSLAVAGRGGVPPTGAGAVALNVTVTAPMGSGFITVYPAGSTRPTTSSLNFVAHQTVPNAVTVKLGSAGQIVLYNGSTATVQLVADVQGYYRAGTAAVPGAFAPLAPSRILDTRAGVGAPAAAVPAHGALTVAVAGRGGVLATGAGAAVLNVTVTAPSSAGYLTVYPAGAARPTASNLNFSAHQTVPNAVTVKLGTGGRVVLYNGSAGTVQVIADVQGYYLSGTATLPGTFVAVAPARVLDTRSAVGFPVPSGPVAAYGDVPFDVLGRGVVPPQGVAALAVNVTETGSSGAGFLTLADTAESGTAASDLRHIPASNLNFSTGQTSANFGLVPLTIGPLAVFNGSPGTVQVVVDVSGWFLS